MQATALSALDAPGLRPWHLKLDVTVFDDAGKNPNAGTVEIWHDDTNSLIVSQFQGASRSVLYSGRKVFRYLSGAPVPFAAQSIVTGFLHPGPSSDEITASQPELRKENFGKTPVDCIMLSRPIPRVAFAPLGLFPTYCLERDGTRLLASYDFGSQTAVRNRIGKFLGHDVTTELALKQGMIIIATAKVVSLATFQPTKEFDPAPEMAEVKGNLPARIASGVIAGSKLGGPQPFYPEVAKRAGISGTVTLRAVIGRDGHIHSLHPMSGPDPDLIIAAVAAVRQWTYKPYTLNGEPTEVDTTIVVNFNLGP